MSSRPLKGSDLEVEELSAGMEYLRLLVFGEMGVGKTRFVGTAESVEEMLPILYVNTDLGARAITHHTFKQVRVGNLKAMLHVVNWLKANKGVYRTIIIDSLTAFYNQLILGRLTETTGPGARTANEDPFVPSQRDYQHATFRMRNIIITLKLQPVNLLCTAMSKQYSADPNDEAAPKFTLPSLPGVLGEEIGQEFDVVGLLYTRVKGKDLERMMQFQPYGRKRAKARSDPEHELPPTMTDPTIPRVWNRLMKGMALSKEDSEIDLTPVDESLEGAEQL
jgi:hypothetical protein